MTTHYCSVDDVKAVLQAGGRFDDLFTTTRDAVTGLFDTYLRRDMRFGNVTEYHDMPSIGRGQPFYLYLDKKDIVEDSVEIRANASRVWDSSSVVSGAGIDLAKGKITLYGPARFSKDSIRIAYSGGWKEITKDEGGEQVGTGVMACPPEIKAAAIQQTAWMLNQIINNDGGSTDSDRGRQSVPKQPTVGGLIVPVEAVLRPYRRVLMRAI